VSAPNSDADARRSERRGRALLWAGVVLGMALTAWGLVGSSPAPPSRDDAVAVVNGQPLSRAAFDRFVAAVSQERGEPLPPVERQRLLDRLVDEELLLQHGLGLGLARHEPTARRVIVQSVIAAVTGAAEDVEPSEAQLRDYHARNPERFVRSGRLVVEALAVPVRDRQAEEEGLALAQRVAEGLADGADPTALAAAFEGVEVPPLPGGPLPVETVRRYLGPTAALRAQELIPGAVSTPLRASAGWLVLRLRDRQDERIPSYEEVERQVRAEWTRAQGEEALRRFLADLRAAAELEQADLALDGGASGVGAEPGTP